MSSLSLQESDVNGLLRCVLPAFNYFNYFRAIISVQHYFSPTLFQSFEINGSKLRPHAANALVRVGAIALHVRMPLARIFLLHSQCAAHKTQRLATYAQREKTGVERFPSAANGTGHGHNLQGDQELFVVRSSAPDRCAGLLPGLFSYSLATGRNTAMAKCARSPAPSSSCNHRTAQ